MTENDPEQRSGLFVSLEAAVIGAVIMGAALYKLWGFVDYKHYLFMFQHLPERAVQYRYCLSIGFRLMMLVIGWGLVQGQEFYRKAAIGVAAVNILLTVFKHPYEVFYHIAVHSEMHYPRPYPVLTGQEVLEFPYFPWISMMVHIMIDVGFSALVIFYLTRPHIRSRFKKA